MHELARDLSGQLDSKMRVLEHLIRQADAAAARLDAATGNARSAPASTAAAARPTEKTPRAPLDSKPAPGVVGGPAPRMTTGLRTEPGLLKIAGNPRFERVYALADAGMSVATIANQIGSQVGEVELILSLRTAT